MHPLIQFKTPTPIFLVALACFGLLPRAQAVSPPPDGAYFGANTAEGGIGALFSLTTGSNNTALGSQALYSLTDGVQNTAVGAQALKNNTASRNTAIGFNALVKSTTGDQNTATGWKALSGNTTGFWNTATGAGALYRNNGDENTATGIVALYSNTTGSANTATGIDALFSNATGFNNTATGTTALYQNTTGGNNTAVGFQALFNSRIGSGNIALGDNAGFGVTTASHVICIGADGGNVNNSCFIGNIITTGIPNGVPVVVSGSGQLGVATSSARFKEEIKPMESASEVLFALKPVTFCYKKDIDPAGKRQLGLVAEDVEAIDPDLIVRDKEGKAYSVRYDQVNAMLLNEFLKEHKTVQEQADTISIVKANSARQEATIVRLEQQVAALTAGLQKVSAQLEVSKAAPQTVLNNQ
jgi:hypothetical protein